MSTQQIYVTAEQLLNLSAAGKRCELIKGVLVEMAPTGGRHGRVALRIGRYLGNFVGERDLGEVFAAETGFRLARDPDTVLAPDVAFVSRARLPAGELPEGFPELAPDLVVEVVSPNDTAAAVQQKMERWLRAGVRMAWVVYPDTRSVAVYESVTQVRLFSAEEELVGDPVLPGFTCHVSELF